VEKVYKPKMEEEMVEKNEEKEGEEKEEKFGGGKQSTPIIGAG